MMSLRILLPCSLMLLAVVSLAAPLGTFDCWEITGRDWARTLVTYPVHFTQGQVKAGSVHLEDTAGAEVPCQFSRIEAYKDGSIKAARLSFYAELPKGSSYHFMLLPGKPAAPATPPTVSARGSMLTLDNGVTAIRLPAGQKTFKTPLAFCADHAKAAANAGKLEQAGLAFGPCAGIRLADGTWTGGSYFSYEPIEVVRQRQGYLKEAPADAWARAEKAAPKVTGYATAITEQGPLFAEARIRFTLSNGGYYQLTARVLANDPAVRLDEVMDLKTTCEPDDALYVNFLVDTAGDKGWEPDCVFGYAARTDRYVPLEAATKAQGFPADIPYLKPASLPILYDKDEQVITGLVPLDPFGPSFQYAGLVHAAQLAEQKDAPFLAIVPQHGGAWRGAHWVFPPKNPHMFEQLISYANGDLVMRWTIRNQPHSQNVLHTGEFDPDFGLTGMRRLWNLVAGPFQYHGTLYPMRAVEGFINLDNYKDWTLAWSDDTRAGVELAATKGYDSAPLNYLRLGFMGNDDRGMRWWSHYRQAETTTWTVDARKKLADPNVPAAEKGLLRAQIAAYASLMAEPDFNTRASAWHQGNPNMPINRFFAMPFAAALIPDHPLAKRWLETGMAYVRYKGGTNIAPGGAWSELISYYPASAPTLVHGALVAEQAGLLDANTRKLATGPVDFTLSLLSPVDPRFGVRVVPGFGHEGYLDFNQWTPAAALLEKTDPQRAAMYAWAWRQQGQPGETQHCNGFSLLTADKGKLADAVSPAMIQQSLASVWLPGFGAVLRAHAGDPNETYFGYRQGYLASHSDGNQGDFVLYSKGAPLTTVSLFGYARWNGEFNKIDSEFGWHSRVRVGSMTDNGGWPGGGPLSGVHRHFFSDSVDYLRGVGNYGPVANGKLDPDVVTQQWTRQVLFLKGKNAGGPNYFLLRDSFHNPDGHPERVLPTWWYQRTLGAKTQVTPVANGFDYTSEWGARLQVRTLQPAAVQVASREASSTGPVYATLAKTWAQVHGLRDPNSVNVKDTMTVNAFGPIPAGQDVLVMLYPQGKDEAGPQIQSLGDGAAKITTSEGTDYVFASRAGMTYAQGDIAFDGIAGAVRVYPTEVHLVVMEGAGTVRYKGYTLTAGQPATKIIPMAEINKGGAVTVPAPKTTITFALDEKAGAITPVAPGVRKQTLATGVAYAFNAEKPLTFTQDGVTFTGTRGGIITDTKAGTTRLVLLDGETIGINGLKAEIGSGPYDLTFSNDTVTGIAEGPGRILYMSMPEGIVQLPSLTISGITYAAGTYGRTAFVPVFDGRTEFTLGNLAQPPVFRSAELW
jgi:hypothetical protein